MMHGHLNFKYCREKLFRMERRESNRATCWYEIEVYVFIINNKMNNVLKIQVL